VKINFEGRDWDFDETQITVKQGIVIHLAHGMTIAEFSAGLPALDARSLQAAYWLMKQQNGVVLPIKDCDFRAVPFAEAYGEAYAAEKAAEEAQAEKAAEEAAAVPTSPPPAGPASPTSGTPADTIPPPLQPQHVAVPTG
jgi:hypothetical protein